MRPSRAAWALVLAHAALNMLVGYALRPTISAGLLDAGHSSAWLGVATVAFALPPLLVALPAGRLVDRTGERPWFVAGGAALAIAAALTCLASALAGTPQLVALLAANAALGLGNLASILAQQTWVTHGAAGHRPDYWFGLFTFATSTGQLLAPAVLWLPGAQPGSSLATVPIALVMVATGVAIAVLGLLIAPHDGRRRRHGPRDPASARPDQGMLAATADLVRRRGVLRALVASSLVLASVDIVVAYLPLLTSERGLDPAWIGGLLMARAVAGMLSRLGLSRLTALAGRRAVMVVGAAVAAIALAAMALPVPAWALAVCMAAYGFASGTVQPLTMSWMTLIAPADRRGLATSLRMVGNRAGQSLVPLAIAAVSVVGGGALAFVVTGATLAASAIASTTAPNDDRGAPDARGA